MAAGLVEITKDNFQTEVLESNLPVLVDFWAATCAPCRRLAPLLDEASKKYAGVVKIGKLNVDEHLEVAEQYDIQGLPTIVFFQNGQEINRMIGMPEQYELTGALESFKPSATT